MNPRAARRFAVIPALLLVARIEEIAANTELPSGFSRQPRTVYHLLLAALVLAGWLLLARQLRGWMPAVSDTLRPGGACFVLCASAGAVAAYGGVMKLAEVIRRHPFHHFFMNRAQLAALGFESGWFRLTFVWALFSFAAAAWYLAAAVSVLRTGTLRTGRLAALAPMVWYLLRAVSMHFDAPINIHNSVAVSSMLSLLALGWVWYTLARYFSLPERAGLLRKTAARSYLALCASVGLALPGLALQVSCGAYADAVLLVADALAAAAAAQLAGRMIQTATKEAENVQQEMD